MGALIAASLAGSTVSLIPWGIAADRFGERPVLGTGLALCGVALLVAAETDGFAALLALLLLAGFAGASVNAASGRAVMQWFPRSQRGLALGVRQTAIPIGGFAASLVLPHLADPAWGFRALGLACLVTAAAGLALLREGPRLGLEEPLPAVSEAPLRDRRLWLLSWGSALIVAPQICLVGFAVLFLHEDRGVSPQRAALVLACIQLLGIGTRIAAGRWSDIVRSRVVPLRRIALATTGLVWLTTVLVSAPLPLLVPVIVASGALAMSWNGLAYVAAAELAGEARSGAAIGVQQTMLGVSAAVLPPAFGALVGASGWTLGFALVALGPLAGFLALRPLARA
jgi:sugar phosphate permease